MHQITFAKIAMAMLAARYTLQKYTKSWGWMPLTAHFLYCKQKFLDWVWGYDFLAERFPDDGSTWGGSYQNIGNKKSP